MLEVFKAFVSVFTVDLSEFAPYVLIGLSVSFVVIFILEAVLSSIIGAEHSIAYYVGYMLINLALTAYFSVEDFLNNGVLFKSAKTVYTFITLVAVLSVIFFIIVKAVSKKPAKIDIKRTVKKELTEEAVSPSRIVEYFKNDKLYTGYLDVNYVKALINDLKTKELSESDFQKIEELELYLMRFSQRQPFDKERAELSEKLSMLIKQLAKYAS